MEIPYTYWQDPKDGMWLGYMNDYPDYWTQGHTLDELKQMLVSLRNDIGDFITSGELLATPRSTGVLEYA